MAGYFWLVFAWLVVKPDLSSRPENATLRSAYDLGVGAGPVWISLAAGTLAYLGGAVTQIATDFLERRLSPSAIQRRRMRKEFEKDPSHRHLHVALESTRSRVEDAANQGRVALDSANISDTAREDLTWRVDSGRNDALDRALDELDLPATLLVGNEPALFAEVDRMRAEGELRITILPPFIAVTMAIATQVSGWAWVGLLFAIALGGQGLVRKAESRQLIEDAIRTGRIQSPAVTAYEQAMARLVQEVTASQQPGESAVAGAPLRGAVVTN